MKTTYSDIEIEYIEGTDTWEFELRGRSRSAPSLMKAKEAIDKIPTEKRKPFPQFEAYLWSYNGFKKVRVTSVADNDYSGKPQFWVSCDGSRSKNRARDLYPATEHNSAVIAELAGVDEQKKRIEEIGSKIRAKLQEATVPAECAE